MPPYLPKKPNDLKFSRSKDMLSRILNIVEGSQKILKGIKKMCQILVGLSPHIQFHSRVRDPNGLYIVSSQHKTTRGCS